MAGRWSYGRLSAAGTLTGSVLRLLKGVALAGWNAGWLAGHLQAKLADKAEVPGKQALAEHRESSSTTGKLDSAATSKVLCFCGDQSILGQAWDGREAAWLSAKLSHTASELK